MPSGDTVNTLVELVLSWGPWFLLPMAFLETAVVTGLVVPAGMALAFAAFLSTLGYMPLPVVVLAAGIGAVVGDQTGYWIGRRGEARLSTRRGRLGGLIRRTEERSRLFFRAYPVVGVTLGRVVSFVRTLMPPVAGMSGIGWLRFTLFDLAGVCLWLLLYISVGTLAGVSWEPMTRALGAGSFVVFLLIALLLVATERAARRRATAQPRAAVEPGTPPRSSASEADV